MQAVYVQCALCVRARQAIDCTTIQCDVADPVAARAAVERAGLCHGLVNNAGITRLAPLLEMNIEDFDAVQNVNVRAAFVVSQVRRRERPPCARPEGRAGVCAAPGRSQGARRHRERVEPGV